MGTTLRDVLDWFVDLKDSFLRTGLSAFDKLFDLQILDITFAEWLILGFPVLMIIGGILALVADWKTYWLPKKLRHWRSKR